MRELFGVLLFAMAILMVVPSERAEAFQVSPGEYYVEGDFSSLNGHITGGLSFEILSGGTPLPGMTYDPLFGPFFGYFVVPVVGSHK